ncbi:hypothetical protein QCA50_010296 [Cerrena zonata]|uniref:BTB domain-containing protein n=1 Tax=Cerrena zonata TaxID=2478898 RepID=A0AAW0G0Z5_9APHY
MSIMHSDVVGRKYWSDDGTLLVHVQQSVYKLKPDCLDQLSSRFASFPRTPDSQHGLPSVIIPTELEITSDDFETLLDYVYHGIPLDSQTSFAQAVTVLKTSSTTKLDFPSINALARQRLLDIFPKQLDDLVQYPDAPDEALSLAVQYDLHPIQKALYYRVATHLHLEDDDAPDENDTPPSETTIARLSPDLLKKCKDLLDDLIGHFTPILFTVATAGHMVCTDVFAEAWMPLVIQPALENNGLCKPIETLQTIIDLDWKVQGLCEECVKDKREEWKGEQQVVWNKMDGWLGLGNGTQ